MAAIYPIHGSSFNGSDKTKKNTIPTIQNITALKCCRIQWTTIVKEGYVTCLSDRYLPLSLRLHFYDSLEVAHFPHQFGLVESEGYFLVVIAAKASSQAPSPGSWSFMLLEGKCGRLVLWGRRLGPRAQPE